MEEKTKPQARTRDLGKGSIPKLLAQLAIPVVVAQIVNLLYNIVDRIYIGHIPGIGAAALTGVGLFAPLLMLINAFAMLSGSGGAPRAAIFMGKKDNETAEKIMANCFSLILIFAVGLTVLFSIFAPKLLRLFGASDATLPYAVEYARIYIFGSIFVLDMGVRGAAIATVLSQAVGAIWVLRFLTGEKTILKLKLSNMKLDPKVFGPCLALGISSFVMISTESLLSISFTSSLSRYGGDVAVGAMTIITSVNQLITMPLQGICQGGQPIISYNFGAGNKDRVKKAFFTQFCVCATFTIAGWLVMMIAPWLFAGLFTSDTNLADYTSWALRIYMAGMFSMGFQVGCQQSFMALGQAKVSLLLACLRKIILLIPLIFILPCFLADKVFAVFLAEPISDILAATVTTITFFMRFDKILEVGVQVKKGD